MSGLYANKRWDVLAGDADTERLLHAELGISSLVARILVARGITTVEAAAEFLSPSLARDWHDPLEIPGMAEAADRVQLALERGEHIAVFGDFDVDGMTSTCLLTQALTSFGGRVDPFIPHRFGEGYGMSVEALTRVIEDSHPNLIITVDNGIAAQREVEWLKDQGVDVVITDHHEPGDLVPQGVPVTDPKLSPDCPSRELAGAGVALKLVCELGRRLGQPDLWWDHTDLAALGTVSDMMILTGENRSLVAYGIDKMRHSHRPGIIALAASAEIELAEIEADTLPFSLIPRLNAAGRMGSTEVAFDLLYTQDMVEATTLAGMLEKTNNERRETEAALSDQALARIAASYAGQRVIVVAGEGWHEGVKGIVASRIVSTYHVPAIVFSVTDGIGRGSGRSVGSVDLFHAVEECQDLLVRFGGHSGAVGVTCEAARIDAFRAKIEQVMAELPSEQFEDKGEVAAVAKLSELNLQTISELDVLQPFGQGNKRPLIGIRGVFMKSRARVGYDGNHLRFVATDGVTSVSAIMFRTPEMLRAYACDEVVDLVADAVNETWQGRTTPKLMVRDILYREENVQSDPELKLLVDRLIELDELPKDVALDTRPAFVEASDYEGKLDVDLEDALQSSLERALFGGDRLKEREQEVAHRLAAGESLCVALEGALRVLVTHLAYVALEVGGVSVVCVPSPREAVSLTSMLHTFLSHIGVTVATLSGSTPHKVRQQLIESMTIGTVDVLVGTLACIDSIAGELTDVAVADLAFVSWAATTAVADAACVSSLAERLSIEQVVAYTDLRTSVTLASALGVDAVSEHLKRGRIQLVDLRESRERETCLASIVASAKSSVVFVESFEEAQRLAHFLGQIVGDVHGRVAPYHSDLGQEVTSRLEDGLRYGQLSCLVCATVPEGIEVSDLILYQLPNGVGELERLLGVTEADSASVYLLFSARDTYARQQKLTALAPARTELVTLYRALMTEQRRSGKVMLDDASLVRASLSIDGSANLTESTVRSGIEIFEELGFLKMSYSQMSRTIKMVDAPGHVELTGSVLYQESHVTCDEFVRFSDVMLTSTIDDLIAYL